MQRGISQWAHEARNDLRKLGAPLARPLRVGRFRVQIRLGKSSLWLLAGGKSQITVAIRAAFSPAGALRVTQVSGTSPVTVSLSSPIGSMRVEIKPGPEAASILQWETRVALKDDLIIDSWPRDLYVCGGNLDPTNTAGKIHTMQRGLRSGIVFGSAETPAPVSFFYFQDFSKLTDYLEALGASPADTVGGEWPVFGYSAPSSSASPLPKAREFTVSSATLALTPEYPSDQIEIPKMYVDLFAKVYQQLDIPSSAFHDWPELARKTVRDLTFSPRCRDERGGHHYLAPYVGDFTKPPESMVQFTVLHPLKEFADWSATPIPLQRELSASIPQFFDSEIGSLVRWLPGERFVKRNEAMQQHEAMDSWYLYHSLFNLSRLAKGGNKAARRLLRRSLPYAMTVARRFNYRWPVFFNLKTLDIMRAEAKTGAGGENDVAGLYSLVMLQADELFGGREYFDEAKRAADTMTDLGLRLGYQTNTTGFAAEAFMRLWKITRAKLYLDMMTVCFASILDNVWLWQCGYGNGRAYPTFFGLFPLRDAPYLAAYEELEMVSKVHDLLNMCRSEFPEPLKFLLTEYVRYTLDRAWYYFPAHLPTSAIATSFTNGAVERDLAVPVEDLQDGRALSGQVGQEIYGSGCALVMTTRHFRWLDRGRLLLFFEYPIFDFRQNGNRCSFTMGGSAKGRCHIRVIPTNPAMRSVDVKLLSNARRMDTEVTAEGHTLCEVRGNSKLKLAWSSS